MSTASRWTLIGMQMYEPSLFDTLELPEGYDKQTFIDALLLEHGEKCALYTDPDFMKYSIGIWSRKWTLELSRIYEALTAEYNPIYNYDRFEEISDGESRTYSSVETGGRTSTDNPITRQQLMLATQSRQVQAASRQRTKNATERQNIKLAQITQVTTRPSGKKKPTTEKQNKRMKVVQV